MKFCKKIGILLIILIWPIVSCLSNNRDQHLSFDTSDEKYETEISSGNDAKAESEKIKYYHVVENYIPKEEIDNTVELEKNVSIKNIKEFYSKLKTEFVYREISFQPLQQLEYYDKDPEFIRRGSEMNEIIKIEGIDTYVNTFNTVTLDEHFLQQLYNQIDIGRNFETEDFIYQGGEIPIILGFNYKKYYNVGDIIQYNYLSENFNFEVIGFWKEGTFIQGGLEKIIFDNYICLPYFDIFTMDISNANDKFQEIYYKNRIMGYILADRSQAKVKAEVEELASSCGLDYTITSGTSSIYFP